MPGSEWLDVVAQHMINAGIHRPVGMDVRQPCRVVRRGGRLPRICEGAHTWASDVRNAGQPSPERVARLGGTIS